MKPPRHIKVYPHEIKPGDEYNGYVNGSTHCFTSITVSPEGVPLSWGEDPLEVKVDYFLRDLTWEEEAEWYKNAVDMKNSNNQLNLMGLHTDLYDVGDAFHEMWNGWVEYEWAKQLIEIVDETFFIVGIAEAPYECWSIEDSVALVAEYKETGDRFWCHVARWAIEEMREQSTEVYKKLMEGNVNNGNL